MRMLMASLLAAFLTAPVAFASDRPVGPETGQARIGGSDQYAAATDPDGEGGRPWWTAPGPAPLSENDQRELSWRCDYWPWNRFCGGHRPGGM